MITHQANNWVLWLQLSGWATRVNEEYSRSWNNKQEFRIHQLPTQKQIFRVADRAVPQPPSCKEAVWLAGRASKWYMHYFNTLYHAHYTMSVALCSLQCTHKYVTTLLVKARLYSRRRIFLLFGNPLIRHCVHGTPPLDSSSSRSYLNPFHTCSRPIYCIRILVLPCQPRRRSNHQFLVPFAKLSTAAFSCVISVCPSAWKNSAPIGWIFMKFDIWGFSEYLSRKLKLH